jgi:pyruvate ferredoxin oxidoreductase alpha subunit
MTDSYLTDDADVAIVTLGSVAGTVRTVIDEMRKEGHKVGMLKIRYMRPFPKKEMMGLAEKVPVLGVLEKNVSFGYEGTVYTNVNSALIDMTRPSKTYNFIAGFGGRDISKEDVRSMFMTLLENDSEAKRVQFIGMGCEIDV